MIFFFIGEIINLRNLERVLAREEEVKKRAIAHKAAYSGPQIRYVSKNGMIRFLNSKCAFSTLKCFIFHIGHFLQDARILNLVKGCHFKQRSIQQPNHVSKHMHMFCS